VVSLLTELAVVLVLRTEGPAFRSRPSRLLLWTTIVVGVFAFMVPYIGPLAGAFDFVPLPAHIVGTIALIVIAYIVATEAAKAWFYRRLARNREPKRS
jgi:Mg2+-importing ATPase